MKKSQISEPQTKDFGELADKPVEPAEPASVDAKDVGVATFDPELNRASVTISNGAFLVFREPKPKHFLKIESWLSNAPGEYRTDSFMNLKIAQVSLVSATFPNPVECESGSILEESLSAVSYEDFLDIFETPEDLEGVANCLGFFRDQITSFFSKIANAQERTQKV